MLTDFSRPAPATVPQQAVFKEVMQLCKRARAAAVLSSCALEIRVVDVNSRDFDRLAKKRGLFVIGVYDSDAGRKAIEEDIDFFKEEVARAFAVAELERSLGV